MSTLRSCFEGSLASSSDFHVLLSSIFLIISNCSAGVIDLLGAITFGSLERDIREGHILDRETYYQRVLQEKGLLESGTHIKQRDLLEKRVLLEVY